MLRSGGTRACLLALSLLAGCDQESQENSLAEQISPPGYVPPPPDDNLPLADHPEFVHWNRFAVGVAVRRKKTVSNQFGSVAVTTTLRLAEKSADQVVVQTQVTVERQGEPPVENPPQSFVYPATFRLPPGMQREQFSWPSLTARRLHDEGRQLLGQEFVAQVFAGEERNETGPMAVRLWRSDGVPGRLLRQEIHGHMHDSIEEVTEIRDPGS